MMRENTFQGGG